MHWRRKWQPTPVFLPGESHGQWSLVGFRLWGRTETRLMWLSSSSKCSSLWTHTIFYLKNLPYHCFLAQNYHLFSRFLKCCFPACPNMSLFSVWLGVPLFSPWLCLQLPRCLWTSLLALWASVQLSSFQSLSLVQPFVTPWTPAHQAFLSFTNSRSLLKLVSIRSVMPSNHLILCHPLLLCSVFLSIRVFLWVSSSHQVARVSASVSVLPVNIQDSSPLGWTGWISLQSKRLPRAFSSTIVQKHQFFSAQLSLSFNSDIHTWLLEKP